MRINERAQEKPAGQEETWGRNNNNETHNDTVREKINKSKKNKQNEEEEEEEWEGSEEK